MKIYTKRGDAGETGLLGGKRLPKHHARIAAYGQVDELNAFLGWTAAAASDPVAGLLQREMDHLFVVGGWLATPADASAAVRERVPEWSADSTLQLEQEIDALEEQLEPLQNFILPGGCELAARLHLARCSCRGAERAVSALAEDEPVDALLLAYLNRLSDWLFVQARAANRAAGVADLPWKPQRGQAPGDATGC